MRRLRGMSLVELVIALVLMAVAILTLISVFTSSSRHAMVSRNRTVALLVIHSLMDEFKAHRYGYPEPAAWKQSRETPVTSYIEGRQQQMEFTKTLTFANGSFVGQAEGDSDEVTIKVEWREGVGNNNGLKEMVVKVPVWR